VEGRSSIRALTGWVTTKPADVAAKLASTLGFEMAKTKTLEAPAHQPPRKPRKRMRGRRSGGRGMAFPPVDDACPPLLHYF
jgi:hypothetical protein